MRGMSWLAENLLASHEGLCFMEYEQWLYCDMFIITDTLVKCKEGR